ncbi:MAG: hypothetical protein A2W00_04560 [Candidatus Eisenbacteria bacterium RBG_16_71_46]|nr:MAG: hypothetical protein A2W00_04560 [Candidatus Eisenbacteria bacterium RBG_16_71_46]
MTPYSAQEVYDGSDGDLTLRFYAELTQHGLLGKIAVCLFRAQKCSARAKVYRGGIRGKGSYRSMAYDRKGWSLSILCLFLCEHGAELGIRFGWGRDDSQPLNSWVLYVDLPQGQVSFHSPTRMQGPDYPGVWDGQQASEERIIAFAQTVL